MISPVETPKPAADRPVDDSSTRASLLVRIRDSNDTEAWAQFNRIYGPLIFRFARRHGFQDSDAADLTQDVLRQVCNKIDQFNYDRELGRFRGWLLTVARFTVARMRRASSKLPGGTGDTETIRRLERIPDDSESLEDYWNLEYDKSLFQWAAEQVRDQVHETTWDAFRLTAVEGKRPAEVAEQLGISIGSVYVARNRVLNRLKQQISEIDDR